MGAIALWATIALGLAISALSYSVAHVTGPQPPLSCLSVVECLPPLPTTPNGSAMTCPAGPIPDTSCFPLRIESVNGIPPDASGNFTIVAGTNIQVNPNVNGIVINTTDAASLSMLGVTGATLLGTNTTCITPLLPSCYDISNQACVSGPLASNCLPNTAHFGTLTVDNLIVANGSVTSTDYSSTAFIGDAFVNGTMTCTGNGTVDNGCLQLGGYTCPVGVPLADSCIPASLVFYDLSVTHITTVNDVVCAGNALPASCIPVVLDGSATPSKYPTTPSTEGIWYAQMPRLGVKPLRRL